MKKSNAQALARYASKLTGGGKECIAVLVNIMRDEANTVAERIAATKELLDRGFGRSAQVIEIDAKVSAGALDVSALGKGELAEFRAYVERLAQASGVPVPRLPAPRGRVIDIASEPEESVDEEPEWEDEP